MGTLLSIMFKHYQGREFRFLWCGGEKVEHKTVASSKPLPWSAHSRQVSQHMDALKKGEMMGL